MSRKVCWILVWKKGVLDLGLEPVEEPVEKLDISKNILGI